MPGKKSRLRLQQNQGKKVPWVDTVVSRQEPGRYLAGIVLLGPQFHAATEVPASGGRTLGARITAAVVGMTVAPNAEVAYTAIAPLLLVVTLATYLELDVEDSHPQLPAVGSEPDCEVCTDSVIPVRQAEAARINSDTLARTV